MKPILPYRTPDHLRHGIGPFILAIRRGVIRLYVKILATAAAGIIFSLIGPALAAWIVASIVHDWRPDLHVNYGLYLLSCGVVLLPILFVLQRRHDGEFFSAAARSWGPDGTDPQSFRAVSYAHWEFRGTILSWAAWLEIALLGPRLVMSAAHQLRDALTCGHAIHFPRAAEVLMTLSMYDAGIDVARLHHPDEEPAILHRILRFLLLHEWISLSSTGDRAWLDRRAAARLPPPLNPSAISLAISRRPASVRPKGEGD